MADQNTSPVRRGILDTLPLALGAIPFGLVVGIAAADSAMPPFVAWLLSPLIFAGAAQLGLLTVAGSATMFAALLTLTVVNARHVMYSAALATEFKRHPRWFRWVGASLIVDQNFALALPHIGAEPVWFRRYWMSASLLMWFNWLVTTGVGEVVGGSIPSSWQIQFAIPILFVGLTISVVKTKPQLVGAMVGGIVGLACAGFPDRLGILIGAVAGVTAAVAFDYWSENAASKTSGAPGTCQESA